MYEYVLYYIAFMTAIFAKAVVAQFRSVFTFILQSEIDGTFLIHVYPLTYTAI